MKGEIITSLDNSMIKEARSLSEKKYRRFHGKFLVDGKKLVNEVILGAAEVDKIFVDGTRLAEFGDILANFNGKVVPVTPKVFDSISENATPQGIIAEVFMKETGEFILEKDEPILILDRIQDPGNLGTIIRTAAASGLNKIVLIDTADQFSPKVVRASSGGIFYVDIYRMTETEIIEFCKNNNIEMLVADMGGENIYRMKKPTGSFALVIGNEGQGVSDRFSNEGKIISLPMKQQMESLNAGICASILMYELVGDKI